MKPGMVIRLTTPRPQYPVNEAPRGRSVYVRVDQIVAIEPAVQTRDGVAYDNGSYIHLKGQHTVQVDELPDAVHRRCTGRP